jgi:hypothetical protein
MGDVKVVHLSSIPNNEFCAFLNAQNQHPSCRELQSELVWFILFIIALLGGKVRLGDIPSQKNGGHGCEYS